MRSSVISGEIGEKKASRKLTEIQFISNILRGKTVEN